MLTITNDAIRNAYIAERNAYARGRALDSAIVSASHTNPFWDGGTDSRGVSHKPVWDKLASFAETNCLSPLDLIKAVFFCWQGNIPPTPAQCSGKFAMECYRQYKTESTDTLKLTFNHYQRAAAEEIWKLKNRLPDLPIEKVWRLAILSPTLKCSQLFRYCLACNTGQADLAESYKPDAMYEYRLHEEVFDQFIAEYVPIDFLKEVKSLPM